MVSNRVNTVGSEDKIEKYAGIAKAVEKNFATLSPAGQKLLNSVNSVCSQLGNNPKGFGKVTNRRRGTNSLPPENNLLYMALQNSTLDNGNFDDFRNKIRVVQEQIKNSGKLSFKDPKEEQVAIIAALANEYNTISNGRGR